MSYGGEIKKQAKVVTVAVHAARFTRSSGRAIMASSRRRMIAVAGTAAVGLTAALAGPAPSASAAITYPQPAITVAGGNTVIAVQTPKDGLYFFWNQYGTTSWQAEQVAASGTTFSAPTIAADGSSVIIAAQGANNSLMFYWQQDGATGWNPETVAGSGTTFSAPSIVANDGSANIVAEGPSNSLDFYWQQNNTTTWHPETVATGNSTFSAPSIAANDGSANVVAEGPDNSLDFYWQQNGTTPWNREVVAGYETTFSAPSVTANDGSANIVAQGPANPTGLPNDLDFYWQQNGHTGWNPEIVAGSDVVSRPAIVAENGGVDVVAPTTSDALWNYEEANGSSVWQAQAVDTGIGDPEGAVGSPASVTDNNGSENIAVFDATGNLVFYWRDSSGAFWKETII